MEVDLVPMSFPFGPYTYVDFLAALFIVFLAATFVVSALYHRRLSKYWMGLHDSFKFLYVTFVKPHPDIDEVSGQQAALEGFYKAQVDTASLVICMLLIPKN